MIAKIDESEGAEKANAIHELVGKTNMDEIFLVRDYVEELPKIDPKNESGLVPTYKIRAAYYYSFDPTTKAEEAEKAFIDLVDDEDLNDIDLDDIDLEDIDLDDDIYYDEEDVDVKAENDKK